MKKAVMLIVGLMTAVVAARPAFAITDGFYDLSETTYTWDSTDADRTKASAAEYDYSYGDEEMLIYTLPWSFSYYGQSYSSINIDTNGNIWFTNSSPTSSFDLPNTGRGPVIAAWNNDLSSQYYGGAFVQHNTNPERVVIEWQTETYTEEAGYLENNFEVVLYQTGKIRFDYKTFGTASIENSGSGISNDDGSHSAEISTLAAGKSFIAEVKNLIVTPLHDSFGNSYINASSAERTYTVTNYLTVTVNMGSASITGTNSSMFTITSNTCTGSLSPNQSCTIKVSFRPTSTGDKSATLSISATNPSALTRTSTLSGTGVYPQLTVVRQGSDWATITGSTGGISCGDTCSASVDYGSSITLRTTVLPGTTFLGWSGGGCIGTGDCTVAINGDTTVTASLDSPPTGVVKISAGKSHVVAVRSDGTLWAWGLNNYGQLGDGTTTNSTSPVQVKNSDGSYSNDWFAASAGAAHTLAIKRDGSLWAWGLNDHGQLGDGTTTNRSAPVQIGSNYDWTKVSAGYYFSVGLRNNYLYVWGQNDHGQLGLGSSQLNIDKIQPYHLYNISTCYGTVCGTAPNTWASVSAGEYHVVALEDQGVLWAWGYNNYGQLGDETTTDRSTPVPVTEDGYRWNYWSALTASQGSSHSAAIKMIGSQMQIWSWGINNYGQLGDGTTTGNSRAVRVINSDGTYSTDWAAVIAGGSHTVALKTGGSLWAWGDNTFGQLGDGTFLNYRTSPVQVGSDTAWATAAAGEYFTVGLKDDGRVYTWGWNNYGQLGIGSTFDKLTPRMVYGNGWIHTITTSATAGGSISDSTWVYDGRTRSFTITPNTGYYTTVTGCNGTLSENTYTTGAVTADCTVTASFAINTFTVSATAGSGGGISPPGTVTLNYGGNQTFTITPNTGYHIVDVKVDGVSQGAISGCSFSNVTANHTVDVTFAINTYTLTTTAGSGGGISPSGTVTLNYGSSQAFTITPNLGYHIVGVTVDGGSQGAISSYPFSNVTANHTISATFSNTYNVTVSRSITDNTTVTSPLLEISCGSTCTNAFTPGDTVLLTAASDACRTFTGWSGACTETGLCSLSMSEDRNVTANFSTQNALIQRTGVKYSTLQNAYEAAIDGDVIYVVGTTTIEGFSANSNSNISITIDGGYDCNFSSKTGTTTLQGNQININSGTVTMKDVIIDQ